MVFVRHCLRGEHRNFACHWHVPDNEHGLSPIGATGHAVDPPRRWRDRSRARPSHGVGAAAILPAPASDESGGPVDFWRTSQGAGHSPKSMPFRPIRL